MNYMLRVWPAYRVASVTCDAGVNVLPNTRPITLRGSIAWNNNVTRVMQPQVLVYIITPSLRNITALVDVDNTATTFIYTFTPSQRDAGRYYVGAMHPTADVIPDVPALGFRLAGMVTTPGENASHV